jgi:hypothetical protein
MAGGLKVELVTRNFNRMLADLAAIDPTISFADIIKNEATAVIGLALRYTRAANAGKIRADHAAREWVTFGGKKYNIAEWKLPNELWARVQRWRGERLRTKLNARGLAKQSWLHLATELGKQVAAPAYVVNANFRGLQYPMNADKREEGSSTNYALTIINSSPVVLFAGGELALLRGMARRTRYFRTNMAHHFYRSLATRASKYPGIYHSPVPSKAD